MSLLLAAAMSAATRNEPPTQDPNPDLIAQTRPGVYNSTGFMVFTDPYGHNGSVVHPDVLDFGSAGWRGHQYWIAATPYYGGNDKEENPCIYWADHPTQWVEATTNPVYPWPGSRWNSDTDLVHDPTTDQLVLVFRDAAFDFVCARSDNGVVWPERTTRMEVPALGAERLSPALVRDPSTGRWVMWTITVGGKMWRLTADKIEGPWGDAQECTGLPSDIWHMNMIWHGTRVLCLMQRTMAPGPLHLATSDDGGLSWRINDTPTIATGQKGTWDDHRIYRGALTLHPNGTHARVWYPGWGTGSDTYRIGYTEVPLSEWP